MYARAHVLSWFDCLAVAFHCCSICSTITAMFAAVAESSETFKHEWLLESASTYIVGV